MPCRPSYAFSPSLDVKSFIAAHKGNDHPEKYGFKKPGKQVFVKQRLKGDPQIKTAGDP